ncbi:MAG: glycosyltransferase family 2 protein [Candidatus Altiarchaeota archaeon]|nr:glycosyltransferase family 2 protein [Candidatus Altiarchaeota archaeon]
MKVVAAIPAYNEEKHIRDIINRTMGFVDEVVVVDDGSGDRTYKEAISCGAIVVKLATNMGVGFATRMGCEIALNEGADVVVTIDGDGQHDPETIPALLQKLKEGYDIVLASRMLNARGMPLSKQMGNRFISGFCSRLFGSRLSDTQTGFRAFTKEAYKKLNLACDGYEVCSEFAYEMSRKHLKYCEVPIKANYDDWTSVKGTNVTTGMKIFLWMLWLRVAK